MILLSIVLAFLLVLFFRASSGSHTVEVSRCSFPLIPWRRNHTAAFLALWLFPSFRPPFHSVPWIVQELCCRWLSIYPQRVQLPTLSIRRKPCKESDNQLESREEVILGVQPQLPNLHDVLVWALACSTNFPLRMALWVFRTFCKSYFDFCLILGTATCLPWVLQSQYLSSNNVFLGLREFVRCLFLFLLLICSFVPLTLF